MLLVRFKVKLKEIVIKKAFPIVFQGKYVSSFHKVIGNDVNSFVFIYEKRLQIT